MQATSALVSFHDASFEMIEGRWVHKQSTLLSLKPLLKYSMKKNPQRILQVSNLIPI